MGRPRIHADAAAANRARQAAYRARKKIVTSWGLRLEHGTRDANHHSVMLAEFPSEDAALQALRILKPLLKRGVTLDVIPTLLR